jgi:hypothetical protein
MLSQRHTQHSVPLEKVQRELRTDADVPPSMVCFAFWIQRLHTVNKGTVEVATWRRPGLVVLPRLPALKLDCVLRQLTMAAVLQRGSLLAQMSSIPAFTAKHPCGFGNTHSCHSTTQRSKSRLLFIIDCDQQDQLALTLFTRLCSEITACCCHATAIWILSMSNKLWRRT